MSILKKLFEKKSSEKPAVQPDPMEDELRRLDSIEAIDPTLRMEEYWHTLHPLVQACHLCSVGWKHREELPFSASDAFGVFRGWEYPASASNNTTDREKDLMRQYAPIKEKLQQQKKDADQRFAQIKAEFEHEKKIAWQGYWEHYKTLSPQMQCLAAWELSKRGASQGQSGFHCSAAGEKSAFPFSVCGWATYQDPRWAYGDAWGVAFCVNKACFGDRKPLLYYLDDDNWPQDEDTDLEIIRQYSSGISNVHVQTRWCKDWNGKDKERRVVLFELNPTAIKNTVQLSEKPVPTEDVGEYIFVLPRSGEFYCLLGEVRDGEMIPLHRDDFCMK